MSSNEPLFVQAVYSFKGKNNDEVTTQLFLIMFVLIHLNFSQGT